MFSWDKISQPSKRQLCRNGPRFLWTAEAELPQTKIEERRVQRFGARKESSKYPDHSSVSVQVTKDPAWRLNPANWSSWL